MATSEITEPIILDSTGQDIVARLREIKNIITPGFSFLQDNAGAHNSIYRGQYLGDQLTETQLASIQAGTFDDLYIGDYWTINGVNWRIAAFDYWLHCGDRECTAHHVVIVPDTCLATGKMNSTNITTGAYVGSDYYTGNNNNTLKATVKSIIEAAFGAANILTYRNYLKNAVTNDYESAGAWYDSTFELMTEQNVYGGKVFGNIVCGTNVPLSYTIDKSQFPLFALDPSHITIRVTYWLRDVVSGTHFACVYDYGLAASGAASFSYAGVRPAFAVG